MKNETMNPLELVFQTFKNEVIQSSLPTHSRMIKDLVSSLSKRPDLAREKLAELFEIQALIEQKINGASVEHYNGKHPKHHLWKIHYQFIIENVDVGAVVMDAGTGASVSYTQELAKKCKRIDCVDKNPELVKKSENLNTFPNVHYKILDITKEVPEGKYDIVIFSHILEHLHNPEEILENYKKITDKIIVRLPRYDDHWMYLVKKDLGLFYFKDHDHKREYTLAEAVSMVEKCGWKIKKSVNDVDVKILAIK